MAKKRSGPNKSKAIRDYYESNPDAKPAAVVDALKSKGITVTAAFVSTIRSTSKKKPGKKTGRRGRPKGSVSKRAGRPAKAPAAKASASVSIDQLVKVKKMVAEVGGVGEARAALAALEKLLD